jgi:hypothetical protein
VQQDGWLQLHILTNVRSLHSYSWPAASAQSADDVHWVVHFFVKVPHWSPAASHTVLSIEQSAHNPLWDGLQEQVPALHVPPAVQTDAQSASIWHVVAVQTPAPLEVSHL